MLSQNSIPMFSVAVIKCLRSMCLGRRWGCSREK